MSDNGSSFESNEFKSFVQKNGIKSITAEPYPLTSSGLLILKAQLVNRHPSCDEGEVCGQLSSVAASYRCKGLCNTVKEQPEKHNRMHQVKDGDTVNAQNYSSGPKWIPGTVIQETGPLSERV